MYFGNLNDNGNLNGKIVYKQTSKSMKLEKYNFVESKWRKIELEVLSNINAIR